MINIKIYYKLNTMSFNELLIYKNKLKKENLRLINTYNLLYRNHKICYYCEYQYSLNIISENITNLQCVHDHIDYLLIIENNKKSLYKWLEYSRSGFM